MATPGEVSRRMRPLPRPELATTVLKVAAGVIMAVGIVSMFWMWVQNYGDAPSKMPFPGGGGEVPAWIAFFLLSVQTLFTYGLAAAAVYALSLLVSYSYDTAVNVRLAERRGQAQEAAAAVQRPAQMAAAAHGGLNAQVVELLTEINDNTLLSDADKSRKRSRMADEKRVRMRREIQQMIEAMKWAEARVRIDDFRAEYPDSDEVRQLQRQLETTVREHRELDIMSTSEQIRSYMSLGLWEKARQTARQLAEKYPDVADAKKMEEVVRMEEDISRKEDRLRLYREIEHLVARKHYRDAVKTAQTLLERYSDSPEAATLHGQMDELMRNADIEVRREMEARIIECSKQNRHKEAYELARTLMEQYPDSPQALALKDQIERLREKAGVN